jgi:Spy/CpxP family protein refolding chaperone
MKSKLHTLLVAATLLAPLSAIAEPAPAPEAGPGAPWGEHGQARMQERMEELQKSLKLTSAQEPAWDTFVTKLREAREDRKEARPDAEALKSMTAIQRLEKGIEFGKVRQAAMQDILAATKSFYAVLTPEQRKTFDDMAPFGARGPRLGHGGGRPHQGMR